MRLKLSKFLILHLITLQLTFLVNSQPSPAPAPASGPVSVFACDTARNPSLSSFGFCNTSLPVEHRVADLVSRLNISEKIGLLVDQATAVNRLGIPAYKWWSEALHGVSSVGHGTHFSNVIPGATSFPQPILTAASFNVSLFKAIGKVVSTEARAMYNTGLAGLTFWSPNINIFRDPRWGRGQETPGEDPLLSSRYGVAYVKGLQETEDSKSDRLKVAACCKHYTAYDLDNWEGYNRFTFNAVVSQQDLDDTFQPPFKSCVIDGNVASVMCSYNQVNGKPTCANPDLLAGVIRGQWKLNGYIVSDCDSVEVMYKNQKYTKTPAESVAKSLLAGLDLDCGDFVAKHAEEALDAKLIDEAPINRAVSNNMATLMRLGFFNGDPSKQPYGNLGPKDACTADNQELAREAARQGIVLLKNTAGSLPMSSANIKSLAVIGPNANVTATMIGNYEGIPCKYTTPLQALTAEVQTTYAPGCANVKCTDDSQVADTAKLASAADATVLVVGGDLSIEAEGLDRVSLNLPGKQPELVFEVAKAAKGPVVLVIMSGGGFDVEFAKTNSKITGILWAGYPGEAGGAAIADVIFGRHNPSGKLPMTWYPQSYLDKVPMTNMNMRPNASTGYPGRTYRFYKGKTVFPFGYGLSYTNFTHKFISAPQTVSIGPIDRTKAAACKLASHNCQTLDVTGPYCTNNNKPKFEVRVRVENAGGSGSIGGAETVFLFASPPPTVNGSPEKQLIGFEKVFVRSGNASATVAFTIDVCRDLSVVDEFGVRKVVLGQHVLHVGDLQHSLNVGI